MAKYKTARDCDSVVQRPLPCPFCGGHLVAWDDPSRNYLPEGSVAVRGQDYDLRISEVEFGYPYVKCLCGARGPKAKAPKKDLREAVRRAIEAWNGRADAQSALF